MRKTIDLPDDLAARVDEYLKQHPGESYSSLIQHMLEREIVRRDRPSIRDLVGLVDEGQAESSSRREFGRVVPARDPEAILKLIGMVSVEPDEIDKEFMDRPEDRFYDWHDGRPR